MGRQVYRREGAGRWTRQDDGVVLPKGGIKIGGFNSIDGLREDDIYAVGFGGEIWRCVDAQWRPIDSPTNVILHCVRTVRKDLVYACGQKGVLLRGNGDLWEQFAQTETTDDLWGMEWFNETLYLSSDKATYSVKNNGEFEVIDIREIKTRGHLHARDGVMWSFGRKNVAWTEDGVHWTDATP
jgi:hypothetical protein